MKNYVRRSYNVLFFALALAVGAGCTADGRSIFAMRPDVNMLESSYAVADYLIQNASGFVTKGDLIEIVPLVNATDPVFETKIGKIIPEQIGQRIGQLGYRVDLEQVLDKQLAVREWYKKPAGAPSYVMTGDYVRKAETLDVNIRIADIKTGRSVSSLRYTLQISKDLANLSESKPLIYRVDE